MLSCELKRIFYYLKWYAVMKQKYIKNVSRTVQNIDIKVELLVNSHFNICISMYGI